MRNLKVLAAVFLMGLASCSTRLDLVNPAEPIPVVYCQMDPTDHTFYLTLTRTFSGDANAYDLARDPDQVFYTQADIRMEGWVGEYKVWETQFKPAGKTKVQGIFPNVPGYCFEAINDHMLTVAITNYRLVVNLPGMASPAYSKIGIVEVPVVKSKWDNQISFYNNAAKEIGIEPGLGTAYCDLICVFRYQQMEGVWVNHSDTFLMRRDISFDVGRTDFFYAELFYKQIAANIKPVNDTIVRKFTSLDLILFAGDIYFRDYVETYVNAGNLDNPPKGNIINGIGLFTMRRFAKKPDMTLDRWALDSLCLGQYTKQLGFVRW